MKFLMGLIGIIVVLFVGGLIFSGVTPPAVTQTEIVKDVAMPETKSAPVIAPVIAPVAPAPVTDASETPVTAPVTTTPATETPATTPAPATQTPNQATE